MINIKTITGISGHERMNTAALGGHERTNPSGSSKTADLNKGVGKIADGGGGGRTITFDGRCP